MKKIVTVIALALICSGAYAQFNQGRILAGGGLGFQAQTHKAESGSTTSTLGKSTSFSLNPKVGYFIIDNLAVGLGLNVTSTSFKDDGSSDKQTESMFTVDPFVRYYLDQGLFFQGQIGFGGESSKNVNGSTTTTTKYGVFKWDLGVGYAYFLNDHVALEPMVMYGMFTEKNKDNDAKLKNSGLSVNIGLQVYLGERK